MIVEFNGAPVTILLQSVAISLRHIALNLLCPVVSFLCIETTKTRLVVDIFSDPKCAENVRTHACCQNARIIPASQEPITRPVKPTSDQQKLLFSGAASAKDAHKNEIDICALNFDYWLSIW